MQSFLNLKNSLTSILVNIGQFWFKNLGLGTTKPTNMLYTRLNQYKTYIWQNYNKQKYCQGCIINRGYTTVYVATLEQYQSNIFFIIPSSANFEFVLQYTFYVSYVLVPYLRQQVSNRLCISFWTALQINDHYTEVWAR